MDINQFMAVATTSTSEYASKNNISTTIVNKSFSKVIEGVALEHTRQTFFNTNVNKVISKRRLFKVNSIGVCRKEFLKHLN